MLLQTGMIFFPLLLTQKKIFWRMLGTRKHFNPLTSTVWSKKVSQNILFYVSQEKQCHKGEKIVRIWIFEWTL